MEKESMIQELQRQLQMQNILIECVYTLHAKRDMKKAVEEMLSIIAGYYQADRAYVFQFHPERKWMDNTYEWCREGVPSEKDRYQHLEISAVERWFPWFEESGEFLLSHFQKEMDRCSGKRRASDYRQASNPMTAPLFYEGSLMGFVGVDNPEANRDVQSLLQSTARFIVHDLFYD